MGSAEAAVHKKPNEPATSPIKATFLIVVSPWKTEVAIIEQRKAGCGTTIGRIVNGHATLLILLVGRAHRQRRQVHTFLEGYPR
jgi:hypothetical protein